VIWLVGYTVFSKGLLLLPIAVPHYHTQNCVFCDTVMYAKFYTNWLIFVEMAPNKTQIWVQEQL